MTDLHEVQELAANTRPCPMCQGHGFDFESNSQAGGTWNLRSRGPHIPTCPVCRGGKVVYLNKICCCGWAAIIFDKEIKAWYCGRTICHNHFKHKPMANAYGYGMGV